MIKIHKDDIIREEVFMELAPDRGSEQALKVIDALLADCAAESAKLAWIDFPETTGWRSHAFLNSRLRGNPLSQPVAPDPIRIGDEDFDPIAHFREWRKIDEARIASKETRKANSAKAINALSSDFPTYIALAEALNSHGETTPTGKPWNAENLRKFMKSL